MSSIIFVAVPQPTGAISVLVVPRLTGTLTEGGMADWAAQLAAAELELVVDPGSTAPVSVSTPPDAALWRTVFPADTAVHPFAAQSYDPPVVEPSSSLLDRINATYQNSAKAVASGGPDASGTVREQLQGWDEPEAPSQSAPIGTGQWIEPDFHKIVSLLREHPAVLRALGLIFDIAPPAGMLAASGRMRVRWPANASIVSPWTSYERSPHGLVPAAGGDLASGMVDLSKPEWTVSGLDVQGAAGRLRDAARAVGADDGSPVSLPTLRSQGLSLLRRDRATLLERSRGNAGVRADLGEETFTAADLVLGYRIDVRRQGAPWRSLTSRLATYTLNGIAVGAPATPEDGHVKANAVAREADGTLHTDEVIARWDGWSLAVPRTGSDRRTNAAPLLPLPIDFVADLAVQPGTLPSLRFGEEYRMRVRVADAAGGGLAIDAPEADALATEFTTYHRFEPIAAPLVDAAADAVFAVGESVEELVVRSDKGVDVAAFSAAHPAYPQVVRRRIAAPRTSLRIAEEHGALDNVTDDVIRGAATTGTLVDPASGGVLLSSRALPGSAAPGASIDQDWEGVWPSRTDKSMRLSAPEAGRPRLEWSGSEAAIRLGQAEQLTLDVSSFFADGFVNHFEIAEWLRELPTTSITTGRHPMATPPRSIHFVHAVRRPLTDPAGTLAPSRDIQATHAILTPSTPTLGVDVPSTTQLDLAASWAEWSDSPDPVATTDSIPSLTVELGADRLPEIRHEFADTKHRRVTYRATAVSRFRRYFDADDPAEAFLAETTLPEVPIPSSAQPPRPVVRSVIPAFRWSGTELPAAWTRIQRHREGGILRVELSRPWYVTGEGEQLAVIVWDAAGPPPASIEVTRTGRDPIRATAALLSFPPVSVFARPDGELFHNGGITAVPYDVWFDDDRWWADIPVPGVAAASYSPLVQLVVARYQATSLGGLSLSETVRADPAPVLPDRDLVVERNATSISVTLSGSAPASPANAVHVSLEQADVEDRVEIADPSGAGDPAWRLVASIDGDLGTQLNLAAPRGTGIHRLVVRETEGIPGDPATAESPAELVTRTVFLDVIPLD